MYIHSLDMTCIRILCAFPLPLPLHLPDQEQILLDPTLLQINAEDQSRQTDRAHGEQEVKGQVGVVGWTGIDDCAGDKRTYE